MFKKKIMIQFSFISTWLYEYREKKKLCFWRYILRIKLKAKLFERKINTIFSCQHVLFYIETRKRNCMLKSFFTVFEIIFIFLKYGSENRPCTRWLSPVKLFQSALHDLICTFLEIMSLVNQNLRMHKIAN